MRIRLIDDFESTPAVIKVIGIGGGGGNTINRMIEANAKGVEFVAINTDTQILRLNRASVKIQIGDKVSRGLGVGGNPLLGRQAAMESKEKIYEILKNTDMVFITAGMGGGTGTGASPIVAQIAKELGALVVAIVTKPFEYEGQVKKLQAESGIKELKQYTDTLIVIPNDKIYSIADGQTQLDIGFKMVDETLRIAIQSISDLITNAGEMNVDFADVRAIMFGAGDAIIGFGEAQGPDRAIKATKSALQSPFLDDVSIDGAKGILVNITSPPSSITIEEYKQITQLVHRAASPTESNIKYGLVYDKLLSEKIRVSVIATGFSGKKKIYPRQKLQQGVFEKEDISDKSKLIPAYLRTKERKLKRNYEPLGQNF